MNNTLNCTCGEVIDETEVDYIITQTFGWLTGIFALVKVFFLTISVLVNKYTKNISVLFVIIGILGAISAIIFGVRINEISIYVRGVIMLILSVIICIAKIVFDIEYDKKHKLSDTDNDSNNDSTKSDDSTNSDDSNNDSTKLDDLNSDSTNSDDSNNDSTKSNDSTKQIELIDSKYDV